jgi:DNA-binding LytR/AlgR family response regulator
MITNDLLKQIQFIKEIDKIKYIHTSPNYKVELQAQPAEEITVSRERVKDFKDWLVKF